MSGGTLAVFGALAAPTAGSCHRFRIWGVGKVKELTAFLAIVFFAQPAATDWQNYGAAAVARGYAIAARNAAPTVKPVAGQECPDCGGTGVVGDGVVEVTCIKCGGDGRLDVEDIDALDDVANVADCQPSGVAGAT